MIIMFVIKLYIKAKHEMFELTKVGLNEGLNVGESEGDKVGD